MSINDKPQTTKPRFPTRLERNWITKAAANAATALSMAQEVQTGYFVASADWPPAPQPEGIQDLIAVINSTALLLIRRCQDVAFEINRS